MTSSPDPAPLTALRPPPPGGRLPPHDVAAEEAVLAALLLSAESYPLLQPLLRAEDFFREQHRWCYEAALALGDRGEPITLTTLAHELDRAGRLHALGGESWLATLTERLPSAIGAEAHAAIIARDAAWRRLLSSAGQIAQTAYRGGPDFERGLAEAEALLLEVPGHGQHDGTTREQLAAAFMDDDGSAPVGIRSGFMDLDVLIGGFRPQSLVVIGARTGVGKSALLLNIARHAARDQGMRVAFFSNELTGQEIFLRDLAADAQVRSQRLRPGLHTEAEEARIWRALPRLAEDPITIFDEAAATVPEIRARCRRLQARDGLDLVIVDYLQLLRASAGGRESRAYELAEITRALKQLARDLELPVVAAAQLNREVEARRSRVPLLSDLRESGAIEQDADVVIFIHRPEMHPLDEDGNPTERSERASEPAQLIVAKNRHGPLGKALVRFNKELATFEDWVEREPEAEDQWWSD